MSDCSLCYQMRDSFQKLAQGWCRSVPVWSALPFYGAAVSSDGISVRTSALACDLVYRDEAGTHTSDIIWHHRVLSAGSDHTSSAKQAAGSCAIGMPVQNYTCAGLSLTENVENPQPQQVSSVILRTLNMHFEYAVPLLSCHRLWGRFLQARLLLRTVSWYRLPTVASQASFHYEMLSYKTGIEHERGRVLQAAVVRQPGTDSPAGTNNNCA